MHNMIQFHVDTNTLNQWQRHAKMYFPALCQPRSPESHKGIFGTLGLIGAQAGMTGAILLAGSSALKCGCGKVWLGFNQSALPLAVIPTQPELMLATAMQLLERSDISAWVIGCGLGTNTSAKQLLIQCLLKKHIPLLLDADALNILAQQPALLADHPHPNNLILTPHPGEAARLLDCKTSDIQNNRHQAVSRLAAQFGAWVVLKGHHSLIASPNEHIQENHSGNPGLATAGSGDVLAGIIGSLLAQHIPPEQAVNGGVWLHGIAADILIQNGVGPIGLCAGEIADAIRWVRNQLTA